MVYSLMGGIMARMFKGHGSIRKKFRLSRRHDRGGLDLQFV